MTPENPSLSLTLPVEARDFADAATRYCARNLGAEPHDRQAVNFSRDLWRSMAELGLLEIAATPGDSAMLLTCVGLEVLGYHGFPGPLAQSVAVMGLSDARQPAWAGGERVPTLGGDVLTAWAAVADDLFLIDGDGLSQARLVGPIETLGATRAGLVERAEPLAGAVRDVLARYHMAISAYGVGAGRFFIDLAAEHARTRSQFGRPIGEFQAVAFPLAESLIGLEAAQLMTRAAAMALDAGRADAADLAGAARLSSTRAALKAGFAAHQTLGAYGVLDDGPVGWLSRRIQEYATLAPSSRGLRASLSLDASRLLDPALWREGRQCN